MAFRTKPCDQRDQIGLSQSRDTRLKSLDLNHAQQRFCLRCDRAKKSRLISSSNQQGWKIFNVQRMEQICLIFNINP